MKEQDITPERLEKIRALNALAAERGQTLAQMALSWVIREGRVTSALVGASSIEQLDDNLGALKNQTFTAEELTRIDQILG